MTVSVLSAAKRLGERSGWTLSNLEMQKMCYISHMFYIGKNEKHDPLVAGNFQAWDLGPVHPELYHAVKQCMSNPVPEYLMHPYSDVPADDSLGIRLLDAAPMELRKYNLVIVTHWEKGAWYKNYHPGVRGIDIPNSDILQEYWERTNGGRPATGAA